MYNGTYGLSRFSSAYRTLIAAADGKTAYNPKNVKAVINANKGYGMTDIELNGNRVLLSESTFTVSGPESYRVDVTGTDAYIASADGSQNYGTTKDFSGNDSFKIVIDIPDDISTQEEKDASFTVTELNPASRYDLGFYFGGNNTGIQSLTLLIPQTSNPSIVSATVKGMVEIHEFEVPFAKVDTNGNYITGARLEIYSSNGNRIVRFDSQDEPVTYKLEPGEYYLEEDWQAPSYKFSNQKVYFTIGNDGTITSGGNSVDLVSFVNEEAYFTFRKLDVNGNTVAGATFVIYSTEHGKYICGMTDSEGYLTQESPTCNTMDLSQYGTQNVLNSTGVYKFLDFDYSYHDAIYKLYAKELQPAYGYELDDTLYILQNSVGIRNARYRDEVAGDIDFISKNGIDDIIRFNFNNYRYIDISKVDSIGGKEIPGATLRVCEKINKDELSGDCRMHVVNDSLETIYVESWTSGTEPHRFRGIQKGVRYVLEEVYAPEGYFLFSGKLEFELVDDQGTVKMYNHETGEEITNPEKLKAVMPNEPFTKLNISKSSIAGGPEIPGATLKICSVESYEAALAAGNVEDCEAVTLNNEKVEWVSGTKEKHIEGLPYGTYRLVETIAPAGYVKQTNSIEFTLQNDGQIVSVQMINKPTTVTISKKDISTGDEIPGAHIQIITADERKIVDEWTSEEGKSHVVEALPFGDYILIETLPAPDYEEGMIIEGNIMTEYPFSITPDNHDIKIDVYNQILTKVPSTGISTLNLFAVGGLLIFVGYETIKIYRRKALNN